MHTIGYEGCDIARCLEALRRNAIETVVDVRELPLSRKPGFSKKALTEHLKRSGIQYLHVAALGTPKPLRDRHRADRDWTRFRKAFLQHLSSQTAALAAVRALAARSNCALLCFEADPAVCHRSLVAAALAQRASLTVHHILLDAGGAKAVSKRRLPSV